MDRDNPFASSYLREGVTRVQKPRLTYRPADAAVSHNNNNHNSNSQVSPLKRTQPHLRLQRRLSLTDRPSSTDDEVSEGDMAPRAAPSLRSSNSNSAATSTRRSSNPRRVVRPADHSRPTVHFTNGRSEVLLTLPTPPPANVSDYNGGVPQLPTAPTSTALSRRPSTSNMHRNSAPVFSPHGNSINNNYMTRRPSFSNMNNNNNNNSNSVYGGSTTGSLSTNHHGTNNSTKRVTFDSSETEDSASCLSSSTQATSVDERDYDRGSYDEYYNYGPDKQQAVSSMAAQEQAAPRPSVRYSMPPQMAPSPVMSMSVAPPTQHQQQPTRRRSRSFSGIDREILRPQESELVHIPARRWRESYAYVPAGEVHQDMEERSAPASTSSTSSVTSTTATETVTDSDKNTQAQFEAHKVALEAQFEQRQQTLEAEKTKLADELHAAVTALGKAQQDGDSLRREANEQRQRMLSLAQENDALKEAQEDAERARDGALLAREEATSQEILELRADLESARLARDDTEASLTEIRQTLAVANTTLDELRAELAQEQETAALFREGKAAFESRCGDLDAKCTNLEGQVVAARDANKELHLLMASQIDDLAATKEALQVRIGILEEEEATRVAATAAAVDAAKAAEDKEAAAAAQFTDEKKALEGKVAAAEEKLAGLETEKAAVTTELEACKAQIETLTADITAKTDEVATLTADLAAANEAKAALQETVDGHEAAVEKARQEGGETATAEATAAATEASDALQATITKLEAELAELKTECETLKAAATAAAAAEKTDEKADGDASAAAPSDTDKELQEKHDKLEAAHNELQEKHTALEASLASEKEAAAAAATALTTAQEEAAASLKEAQDAAAASAAALTQAQEGAAALSAQVATLPDITDRLHHLQAAYATSEAEGMALRDQLAKMRAKLAGVAGSVASNSSSATKKSLKGKKDELVIVRTHGDRGRFQVMRKSELHRSRSNSRSSRKTDYDST
ncbi:hypothetical protein SBRCBS47491_006951 [Sporothrix bragantina]|uniref:Uncharacterized protein n=1 Tax=Sporothrix bragantina TaxID=671064 RepID=A0ABP0C967_9PEZI